jgi:spore cortex biosynthesis protein YabQ
VGLFAQLQAFFLTFILGIAAGLIFHYYQSTIRNWRLGKYLLYLMDFIWCIILIIIMAAALLLINQGEIRVYVFIALISGGVTYYKCLARKLQSSVQFLGRSTAYLFKKLGALITRPLRWLITWIYSQYNKRKIPPIDDDG